MKPPGKSKGATAVGPVIVTRYGLVLLLVMRNQPLLRPTQGCSSIAAGGVPVHPVGDATTVRSRKPLAQGPHAPVVYVQGVPPLPDGATGGSGSSFAQPAKAADKAINSRYFKVARIG